MGSARLLIYDSDQAAAGSCELELTNLEPTELIIASDLDKGRKLAEEEAFDRLVVAVHTPAGMELEHVVAARNVDAEVPAVAVCRKPTAENALAALKLGAI